MEYGNLDREFLMSKAAIVAVPVLVLTRDRRKRSCVSSIMNCNLGCGCTVLTTGVPVLRLYIPLTQLTLIRLID